MLYIKTFCSRLSGLSPFEGDTDAETASNITRVDWDFDDGFEQVSEDAKKFILDIFHKNMQLVNIYIVLGGFKISLASI